MMTTAARAAFGAGLASLGFRGGPARLRSGGLVALVAGDWCTFRWRRFPGDPPAGARPGDEIGKPGLWKWLPPPAPGGGRRAVREFHLPLAAFLPDDGEGFRDSLAAAIHWVEATAGGTLPAGWTAPPANETASWARAGRLTVQSRPFAVQGELVREPGRLALRFPLLPAVPAGLADSRRAWLEEVIVAARRRWRLVRVGWTSGAAAGPALAAEVDLSGAPPEACEPLAWIAADALRWAVSWLVVPVRFLSDPDLACEAWEVPPERAWPAERSSTRARHNRWNGYPAAVGP
jgi:hypothetical protein